MHRASRAFQVEVKSSGHKWKSVKTEIRPGPPGPTSSPRKSPEARLSARAAADALFSKSQAKK